jgi:hypothetical protein
MPGRRALPVLLVFVAGCTIVNGLTIDPIGDETLPPSTTVPEPSEADATAPLVPEEASVEDAGTTDAAVDAAPRGPLRVFVTSSTRNGRFGGLAGGDAYCQNHAVAAGLGGTWTAWLSTAAVDAIDRITGDGPWLLLDGTTVVAENKARLASGSLLNRINMNEKKGIVSASNDQVWTATGISGRFNGPDCGNWDTGGSGIYGEAVESGSRWTRAGGESCGNSNRLYCFEK